MDLKTALSQLDSLDDGHWTQEGLPRIEVLEGMVGEKLTRQQITDVAPKFSRSSMELPEAEKEEVAAPSPAQEILTKMAESEPMEPNQFAMAISRLPADALSAALQIVKDQMEDCNELIAKAEAMKNWIKINRQTITTAIQHRAPEPPNQTAISEYLQSQQDLRAAKVEATREILKGIDPKQLDPRAAIDRAFARKTARGGKRPTRV